MTEHPLARTAAEAGQAERIQLLRRRKDQLARWMIALGGMGVVATMLLIFGYLLWAVIPLLGGASSYRSWAVVFTEEFEQLQADRDRGH